MLIVKSTDNEILIKHQDEEEKILILSYRDGFKQKNKSFSLPKGISRISVKCFLPNSIEYSISPVAKKALYNVEGITGLAEGVLQNSMDLMWEGNYEQDPRDFANSEKLRQISNDLFDIAIAHLQEEKGELMEMLDKLRKDYLEPSIKSTISKKLEHKKDGWHVYSENGKKHLGGPYDTKKEAEKRLREVEYFKEEDKKGKEKSVIPAGTFA